jgi:hypothetical protein
MTSSSRPCPSDGGPPTVSAVLGKHADMLWTDNYNPAIKAVLLTGESSKNYPGVKTLTDLGHAISPRASTIPSARPRDAA